MTLQDRFAAAGSRPSGFDYLRIVLAAAVILIHSVDVAYGPKYGSMLFELPWRIVVMPVVPFFFAVSGFLVAGSLYRCATITTFLSLRVLRLLPALAVEVLICALVLGPMLTKLPLTDYFSAPEFYRFFFNLAGSIQYVLPGVFTENPWAHSVHAQLWTVPYEINCYIVLAVFALTGIVARRSWLLGAVIAGQLLFAASVISETLPLTYEVQHVLRGRLAAMCFITGVAFYACASAIRASRTWFIASVIAIAVLCTSSLGEYLAVLPIVYVTVYLGTLNPPRLKLLLKGDYSYGMYVYGFPLQQLLMLLLPGIAWYQNALLGLLLAFACAYLSWWYIEKPALGLKPRLMRWSGEPGGGHANGGARVAGTQIANAG